MVVGQFLPVFLSFSLLLSPLELKFNLTMSVTRLAPALELTVYEIGKGSREFSEFHQKFNGILVPELKLIPPHVAAIVAAVTTFARFALLI